MSQDLGAYAEALKTAEVNLKEAAARLGNFHPDVLNMLDQYGALLRKSGQIEKAEKLEAKAKEMRAKAAQMAAAQGTAAPASGAAAAGGAAATSAPASGAATELSEEEQLAREASAAIERANAKAAAAKALEEKARAAREAREAAGTAEISGDPDIMGSDELHLFDSDGKHVAVVSSGGLFTADGKNLGRWDESLEAFIDRKGWYLGQIVDGNRLARDTNWQFKHMNFGDKGNEGNRSGFSRQSDIERTTFDKYFEDVELPDV